MTAALLAALLSLTNSFQPSQLTNHKRTLRGAADDYAQRWDALVLEEYRATASELRRQRATWPKRRLEEAGVSLFGTAAPHSELFGEKILRVTRSGEVSRVRESFTRGDVLIGSLYSNFARLAWQLGQHTCALSLDASWCPFPVCDMGRDDAPFCEYGWSYLSPEKWKTNVNCKTTFDQLFPHRQNNDTMQHGNVSIEAHRLATLLRVPAAMRQHFRDIVRAMDGSITPRKVCDEARRRRPPPVLY